MEERTTDRGGEMRPGLAPLIDISSIPDDEWQLMCLVDRLKNPGKYRVLMGEDVDAVIA